MTTVTAGHDAVDESVAAAPPWWQRPWFAFLVVACVFGVAFAVTLPPLGGYDEGVHFLRAWQVSDGGVFARSHDTPQGELLGGDVPASLPDDLRALIRDGVFANENDRDASHAWSHLDDPAPHGPATFISFESAAVYAPAPYLPAAVAIRVGRALGLSAFALTLLARVVSVAAFAALGALAIRRIPRRRWVLAVVMLTPVAVFQAATVSADALTTALALLLVADAVALTALPTERIPRALLVEVALVTLALALAKQPYFAIAALLGVPAWRHRGRLAVFLGGVVLGAGAIAVAWSSWAQARYVPPRHPLAALDPRNNYAYRDVDPTAQLEYVRGHPWSFLRAIGETIGNVPGSLAHDVVAQTSWWRVPTIIAVLAALLLVAAALVDAPALPAARAFAILGAALSVVITLTIFLLAYTGWNAVRAPRIDAFQGRYLFPPLALLLLLVIPPRRRAGPDDHGHTARVGPMLVGASAVVLLTMELGLAYFFYA